MIAGHGEIAEKKELQILMTSPHGTLFVKCLSGRLTHDTDWVAKMSPYLVIIAGGIKYETKPHKGAGKFPEWRETISIRYQGETSIICEVWDKDIFSDENVGIGTVNLVNLTPWTPLLHTVRLDYKGQVAGEVFLEIELRHDA